MFSRQYLRRIGPFIPRNGHSCVIKKHSVDDAIMTGWKVKTSTGFCNKPPKVRCVDTALLEVRGVHRGEYKCTSSNSKTRILMKKLPRATKCLEGKADELQKNFTYLLFSIPASISLSPWEERWAAFGGWNETCSLSTEEYCCHFTRLEGEMRPRTSRKLGRKEERDTRVKGLAGSRGSRHDVPTSAPHIHVMSCNWGRGKALPFIIPA